MAYAAPGLRERHVEVASPLPTGPWRSVGASNNAFAIESFVDELAHRSGRDPLEYRLALLAKAPRHAAALRLAAERAGWGAPLGPGRGRGIAVYRCFGSVGALVIEASVAGRAIRGERAGCAIDCGIAVLPDAVHAQLEGSIALGLSAALLAFLLVRYRGDTLRRFRTLDRGALIGTACFFGICAIRPSSTIAFRPFSFLIDFCTVAQFVSVPPSQRWFT